MPTPEQLSAEKRKRVAEVCTDFKPDTLVLCKVLRSGRIVVNPDGPYITHKDRIGWNTKTVPEDMVFFWEPKERLEQKDALVSTVAQMINDLARKYNEGVIAPPRDAHFLVMSYDIKLRCYIANNDTNALEALAYELIEREG